MSKGKTKLLKTMRDNELAPRRVTKSLMTQYHVKIKSLPNKCPSNLTRMKVRKRHNVVRNAMKSQQNVCKMHRNAEETAKQQMKKRLD